MNLARCYATLLALAVTVAPHAARAVDRSLGAGIPKPPASGAPWNDGDRASLTVDIDALLRDAPALRGAHSGLLLVDVQTGAVLYARNADDAFIPASTLKLLTGSAALETLGTAFRFRTEAYVTDPVESGFLRGTLHVRGSGDTLIDDSALHDLAVTLRAAGIRRISGGVHGDRVPGEQRYLPGWSWDDFPYDYAAAVESLGYEHNRVIAHIVPGRQAGETPAISVQPWGTVCDPQKPCRPALGFAVWNATSTGPKGSELTLDAAPADTAGAVTLSGSIAAGAAPEDIAVAVPSPTQFLLAATRRALDAAGIDPRVDPYLHTADPLPERVLWAHDSEPLGDIMADMWWPSDNLLAEEVLRAVGTRAGRRTAPSTDGIARENAWLTAIGIDPATVTLSDGSGLSVYNRLAPRTLTTILLRDWNGPYRDLVLDDLPIAGVRGTLESSYKGTASEGRVFAKTGSMSHVNNIAGYIATQCHGTVAFAFLVDDWLGSAADLRDLRARVFTRLIAAPC